MATDLIEYLDDEIENDTLVIMQLMELASDPNVRRPQQRWAAPITSESFADDLLHAIEEEDAPRAIGLVATPTRRPRHSCARRASISSASAIP